MQKNGLTGFLQRIWPFLIEAWIAAILLNFFLVRILGSQTGQRILAGLTHRRQS